MFLRNLVLIFITACCGGPLLADDYEIDPEHSFVTFRIQHLGFSWLYGQFRDVSGHFSYDSDDPGASRVVVSIDAASLDTNHEERDRHLRSADFLDVERYPKISFESTRYSGNGAEGLLEGNLTLHGITRPIKIRVTRVGEGRDPWLGYRAGFHGSYTLARSDFGMDYNLGRDSKTVEVELSIEGIRQ